MINNFTKINIYEKPKLTSKLSSQLLYGEKFTIIQKKNNWLKIKTNYDNYIGYIKNKKFLTKFYPKFKIFSSKSPIYIKKGNRFFKTKKFLFFGSSVEKKSENKTFLEFEKNKWIQKKHVKKLNHFEKNYIKIFKLFLGSKYLWGGKSVDGIDCSALIQIYFFYNRIFFPRDTKDQIKYCKKNTKKGFFKGDIIFWKGHVGICLSQLNFLHAYGPKKKVLIMPIYYTLDLIRNTANLVVKKTSNLRMFNLFQN